MKDFFVPNEILVELCPGVGDVSGQWRNSSCLIEVAGWILPNFNMRYKTTAKYLVPVMIVGTRRVSSRWEKIDVLF